LHISLLIISFAISSPVGAISKKVGLFAIGAVLSAAVAKTPYGLIAIVVIKIKD